MVSSRTRVEECSLRSDLQVVHVSEVPGFLDVLMLDRHTVSGCPFPTVSDHCKDQSLER